MSREMSVNHRVSHRVLSEIGEMTFNFANNY
jgi:hypothetical protein